MRNWRSEVNRTIDRVQARVGHDIRAEMQRHALASTAEYVAEHMMQARMVRSQTSRSSRFDLIDLALELARPDGMVLEFGVASGESLRHIASKRLPAHGFDSFKGLPEPWIPGVGKGHFAQDVPDVGAADLHIGWFEETLPGFLATHAGPVAFGHLDADLYSSTVTVLTQLEDRFLPDAVLLFDDYFNLPGWQSNVHKAFVEFTERTGRRFEYVAYNGLGEGVLVQLRP